MTTLYCACCGRPFIRTSARGPAPRYCSQDCRLQMAVRRRAWTAREAAEEHQAEQRRSVAFGWTSAGAGRRQALARWT